MWIPRQRQHPALRFTAAVMTSLWLVAVVVCGIHCAGLLSAESYASSSCCHRQQPTIRSSGAGAKSLPKPSNPREADTCGCVKAYALSEVEPFSLPPLERSPQHVEQAAGIAAIRFSSYPRDLSEERHRCVQPAFLLGRGLRTHAPPRLAV